MKHTFRLRGDLHRKLNKADTKCQLTWRDRRLLSSIHGKTVLLVAFGWHLRHLKRLKQLGVIDEVEFF